MEPKYRVRLEWDDLLQVRVVHSGVPGAILRAALVAAAESLLMDEIAARVVRRADLSVRVVGALPSEPLHQRPDRA